MEELKLNKNTIEILEYNQIIETLKSYALSDMAKEIIEKLEPYVDIKLIERHMEETTEARAIVDKSTNAPLQSLTGINFIRDKIKKGEN
jgi:dsDNA-specific endonuclease/ATPase MutS2